MAKGKKGHAYNATNPDTFMTIKAMANTLFAKFAPERKIIFDQAGNRERTFLSCHLTSYAGRFHQPYSLKSGDFHKNYPLDTFYVNVDGMEKMLSLADFVMPSDFICRSIPSTIQFKISLDTLPHVLFWNKPWVVDKSYDPAELLKQNRLIKDQIVEDITDLLGR